MESWLQAGAVGVICVLFGLTVRWLLGHVDQIHKDQKELIANHLTHSTQAQTELASAIRELKVHCQSVEDRRGR